LHHDHETTHVLFWRSSHVAIQTILFATDFSPESHTRSRSPALARDYRAHLIVMHVIEPVQMGFSE